MAQQQTDRITTTAGAALAAMRTLPLCDAVQLAAGQPVLVLAPHADDEALGCGGLLAGLRQAGIAVHIVYLTDGTGSHPNSLTHPPDRLRRLRETEALCAAAILGVSQDGVTFLRTQDTRAPQHGREFDLAVARLGWMLSRSGAATLLAPWRHDPHCDHVAAHLIATAVAARAGVRHLAYPVWGWTLPPDTVLDHTPIAGHRVPVGDFAALRRRALEAHASQRGHVIHDDPSGFALDDATLAAMLQPFEVFLSIP